MKDGPRNLLIPFRRDRKRDFACGDGQELLASKVRQVLLTEGAIAGGSGELPWRTSFGAALPLLRHQNASPATAELARVYVRQALARWMPEVEAVEVEVVESGPRLGMRVVVRLAREEARVEFGMA